MAFLSEQTNRRSLGSIAYAANGTGSVDLDTGSVLMRLMLRLRYTVTVTTTDMSGPLWNAVTRLIRNIEVQVQGRDTTVNIDGEGALMHALLDYGTLPDGTGTFGLTAAGSPYVYDIILPVTFILPRSLNPLATALDLRGISQASLIVQWGALGDLVGTVGGGVISAVTLDVYAEYLDGIQGGAFAVRELGIRSEGVTGTDPNFSVTLDKGTGLSYRSFRVATVRDNVGVTTILDGGNVRVISGNQTFDLMAAEVWRGLAKTDLSLETELSNIYPLSLPSLGRTVQSIPTNQLNADLRIQAGVTYTSGTERLLIYTEAIRPFLF